MSETIIDKPESKTTPGCCAPEPAPPKATSDCCAPEPAASSCCDTGTEVQKRPFDWLLWGSAGLIAVAFALVYLAPEANGRVEALTIFTATVVEMMGMMWWGILLGILAVALLGKVPREFVVSALGTGTGVRGMGRAVAAGVLLDLCNHGILMVAARLYERGASTGQVIAFLVASPWNSFSLTLILIALIGLPWTVGFILLSMVVAMITGLAFEWFEKRGTLPKNPHTQDIPEDFDFWPEARAGLKGIKLTPQWVYNMMVDGAGASRMVLRWILFGVVLAGILRALMSGDQMEAYFGPTMFGLLVTMLFATIIEVCSEGTAPVAADITNIAGSPGNGFAFLMTGVATDYTEIMVLREATGGWKIPLFLPLITVPQVMVIAWLINQF